MVSRTRPTNNERNAEKRKIQRLEDADMSARAQRGVDDSTATVNTGLLASHIADTGNPHSVTAAQVGLGNVTNHAQTKASVVPNTAPSAGQMLVGNAGGTAYAPVSASGDVTVSSTGAHTIANDAVTYAKMQNVSAASKLLGRGDSGSGDPQEITLGTGLSMSGTTLNSSGGGAMTYIGSASVAGSAATTLSISGLDLDTDGRYIIELELKNATASTTTLSFYFNSDTTAANYDGENLFFSNATSAFARSNVATFTQMITGGSLSADITLSKDVNNKPGMRFWAREDITSNIKARGGNVMWRTAGTNVTGITISSSVANALAIGSRIRVWKVTT